MQVVRHSSLAWPNLLGFIITVELLAIMIRTSKEIQGNKISQFAKDSMCFARSADSLSVVIRTVQTFANFSGLHLNLDKSAIISVGAAHLIPTAVSNILVRDRVKILGIWFARSRTKDDHYDWNFSPQIDELQSRLSAPFQGKVRLQHEIMINSRKMDITQHLTENMVLRMGNGRIYAALAKKWTPCHTSSTIAVLYPVLALPCDCLH